MKPCSGRISFVQVLGHLPPDEGALREHAIPRAEDLRVRLAAGVFAVCLSSLQSQRVLLGISDKYNCSFGLRTGQCSNWQSLSLCDFN